MLAGSEKAAPAAQQLGECASAAGDAIHAKTDPLRDTRDEWVESVRTTVRSRQRGLLNAVWMLIAALVILPAVGLVAWALTDQSRQPNEDSGAFLLERTP
jgi:multidrug efflux pump subunit AcrB